MEDLFSYNYFQNNNMTEYRRLLRMDEACFNFFAGGAAARYHLPGHQPS